MINKYAHSCKPRPLSRSERKEEKTWKYSSVKSIDLSYKKNFFYKFDLIDKEILYFHFRTKICTRCGYSFEQSY